MTGILFQNKSDAVFGWRSCDFWIANKIPNGHYCCFGRDNSEIIEWIVWLDYQHGESRVHGLYDYQCASEGEWGGWRGKFGSIYYIKNGRCHHVGREVFDIGQQLVQLCWLVGSTF